MENKISFVQGKDVSDKLEECRKYVSEKYGIVKLITIDRFPLAGDDPQWVISFEYIKK